jgi:hypothetical protein
MLLYLICEMILHGERSAFEELIAEVHTMIEINVSGPQPMVKGRQIFIVRKLDEK